MPSSDVDVSATSMDDPTSGGASASGRERATRTHGAREEGMPRAGAREAGMPRAGAREVGWPRPTNAAACAMHRHTADGLILMNLPQA